MGPMGLSVLSGSGAPSASLGRVGEIYVDVAAGNLYPAKTESGWSSSYITLVGKDGKSVAQTLPPDFVANSFVVRPQSGDTSPVQFALGDGNGSTLFTVDAQGNVSNAGTLKVSGGATFSGALSASGAVNTGALTAASAAITGNETVGGSLTVNGTATFATLTGTSLTLSGNLTVNGTSTLGATSTGALTATSLTSTGTTQSAGHIVSSNGSAAAPTFSFTSQQDTGLYLGTASGTAAVLALSVNGANAFNLSKTGLSLPGTLTVAGVITGQSSLSIGTTASVNGAITGASTLAITGGISGQSTLSVTGAITGGSTLGITGAITGQSTLAVTGAASARTLTVSQGTSQDSSGNIVSTMSFPGAFGGTATYPNSGVSSDSLGNLIFSYQGRSVIAMANPGFNANAGTTPATAFGINFTAGAYTFGAGGATALLIGGNGSTTIGGGLSGNSFPCIITQQSGTILSLRQGANVVGTFDTTGNATFTNVVTSAGFTLTGSGARVTFSDNSVQTTAYTSVLANNQSKWIATTQGSAAAPAFTFTANADTGLYLKGSGATGASLALSVNSTDALLLASSGVSVPGTFGVTGATSVAALTASALVKATAFTITATGGALTFADGTTQTTAAGATAAGSSAIFTATSNGTAAAPAYTFTNSTSTGLWLVPSGPSLIVTVGGTNTLSIGKGNLSVTGPLSTNSTLSVTALATFGAGISVTGSVVASTVVQGGNGSATAPVFTSQFNTNTGVYFENSSGTSSRMYVAVNGVQTATFTATGQFTATGPVSASQFAGGSYATTNANGSTGGVQYGINNTTGLYVNTTTSGNPVVGLSQGSSVLLSGNNNGLLVPVSSSFTAPATHSATVTSTTAAGTPSFVSSQGFPGTVYGGGFACSATAAPTTPTGLYTTITFPDGTSPQVVGRSYINERGAGSVLGFHFYLQNPLTTTCQVRMNVNGTNTPYVTIAAGSTTGSISYKKNDYPLPNNGYCYMMVVFGSASTGAIPQLQGNFTLELPA